MKVKVMGAHNTESADTRHACLLVDGVLALDAGGLTANLSFADQMKIKAVLITHGHYDHMRDIPALAMAFFLRKKSFDIYTHQAAHDNLFQYLLNGQLYPEFQKRPEGNPTLRTHILEASRKYDIAGYSVQPEPVMHAIPTMGYQVTAANGKSLFYTGDTGDGLKSVWENVSPDVLFIELTAPNWWGESARKTGHLTPSTLEQELRSFLEVRGRLPRVITTHINPEDESTIREEISGVSKALGMEVEMAFEGMEVEI